MKTKNPDMSPELAEAFVSTARKLYDDEGSVEVDEYDSGRMQVSASDNIKEEGGAYVQAWVWVKNEGLPEPIRKKFKL